MIKADDSNTTLHVPDREKRLYLTTRLPRWARISKIVMRQLPRQPISVPNAAGLSRVMSSKTGWRERRKSGSSLSAEADSSEMNNFTTPILLAAEFRVQFYPSTCRRQSLPVCLGSMFGWYEDDELAQHSVPGYFLRARASGGLSCRPCTRSFGSSGR